MLDAGDEELKEIADKLQARTQECDQQGRVLTLLGKLKNRTEDEYSIRISYYDGVCAAIKASMGIDSLGDDAEDIVRTFLDRVVFDLFGNPDVQGLFEETPTDVELIQTILNCLVMLVDLLPTNVLAKSTTRFAESCWEVTKKNRTWEETTDPSARVPLLEEMLRLSKRHSELLKTLPEKKSDDGLELLKVNCQEPLKT